MSDRIDNVTEHDDMSTEERINLRNVKAVRDDLIRLEERFVKLAAAVDLMNQNQQALNDKIELALRQTAAMVAMSGGGGSTTGG